MKDVFITMQNSKIIILLVQAVLLTLVCANASAETANKVVAVVNGEMISLYQLEARTASVEEVLKEQRGGADLSAQEKEALRQKVLDSMVDNKLLRDEALRLGLEITPTEIINSVNKFKTANNMSERQFEQMLAAERMTRQDFEEKLKDDTLRSRIVSVMVTRKIAVTPEEVDAYYADYLARGNTPADLPLPEQGALHVIVLSPKFDAESLYKKIVSGEINFAEAAQKHSIGPAAQEGGDLGVVSPVDLDPHWRKALEQATPGVPTKPFSSGQGTIILLLDKTSRGSASAPKNAIKEQIKERLFKAKMEERFMDYIKGLRERAIIEIRL